MSVMYCKPECIDADSFSFKDLDITDLSAMVEHGGLDIMCLNKHRHSSSSSTTPEKGKKRFDSLRVSLTEDYPKKNAEILSAQYGTNLLLFGAALMLAVSNHGQVVREEHLLSFISTIMIVQLLWMLWYSVRRDRQKTNLSEKDAHAGTRWLRGTNMSALIFRRAEKFKLAP